MCSATPLITLMSNILVHLVASIKWHKTKWYIALHWLQIFYWSEIH